MSTFGTMVDRIAAELDRTASGERDQIKDAIITAIDFHKWDPYYFNTDEINFTQVVSQDEYDTTDSYTDRAGAAITLDEVLRIEWLKTQVGTVLYRLEHISFDEIDSHLASTSHTGYPDYWARRGNVIRFWPIPTQALPITGYIIRAVSPVLTASSSEATANAWMSDAEEMIRCRAKADMYTNVLGNPERATQMVSLSNAHKERLKFATEGRETAGVLIPMYF